MIIMVVFSSVKIRFYQEKPTQWREVKTEFLISPGIQSPSQVSYFSFPQLLSLKLKNEKF